MTPLYVVWESKANGPGNKPHRVVVEIESKDMAAEGHRVIESENAGKALELAGGCPACEEGLKIIKKSRFLEGL